MNNEIIIENWDDMAARDRLMEEYGDSEFPFIGENDEGEDVRISVFPDKVILETMQSNGWIRKNYYYHGEERTEEIFAEKWK